MTRIGTILAPCAALLLVTSASGDRIHRTDGKVLDDITITEETLAQVLYKRGNNEQRIPSDEVLEVEFEKKPRLVDEADQAVVEDDVLGALDLFDTYVDGQIQKPSERRMKWAPAYAAHRAVDLRMALADTRGVIDAANRLIQNFPDSRYLPTAYLAKAGALLQAGQEQTAQATLEEFRILIESRSLSKRWLLECRLAQIQADTGMKGDEKRDKLAEIIAEAGKYPTVSNGARVAEGQTYLAEASSVISRNQQAALELVHKARDIFERIVANQQAEAATLAGAYTGLGEALFNEAVIQKDNDLIREAVLHFLRVDVLYGEQSAYVPKALFYAMRCFKLSEQAERARDVKLKLKRRYPESVWATEADKF